MNQLTVEDILKTIKDLEKSGMTMDEINRLPIYLGSDDELNDIHTCWYCNLIDHGEDDDYMREMINNNTCNIKLANNKKAILLS